SPTSARPLASPCAAPEQPRTRTLPPLVLPEMARLYGVRMPATVEDVVDEAIGDLFDHQRGSGGFGFWEDDPVVPWLSAYAMLAVETAAKKGYFVPKGARDSGIAYLRQVLDQTRIGDGADEGDEAQPADPEETGDAPRAAVAGGDVGPVGSEDKPKRAYATLAFVADVLASLGQADPGYLNRLFDARAHRPLFTQAVLLHAMALAHMPAAELDALVKEIEARVRVDGASAYVDEADTLYADFLDSPSRTTALALRALVAARPRDPLAPRLARGLLDHRVNGAWRSTQENVWALLALDDYRRAAEPGTPNFEARVFLRSAPVGAGGAGGRARAGRSPPRVGRAARASGHRRPAARGPRAHRLCARHERRESGPRSARAPRPGRRGAPSTRLRRLPRGRGDPPRAARRPGAHVHSARGPGALSFSVSGPRHDPGRLRRAPDARRVHVRARRPRENGGDPLHRRPGGAEGRPPHAEVVMRKPMFAFTKHQIVSLLTNGLGRLGGRRGIVSLLTNGLRVLAVPVAALALALVAVAVAVARTPLPSELREPVAAGSIVVADREGRPLREVRARDGTRARWVTLDGVPAVTRQAMLAAEDARFFAHPGVDVLALVRAAALDLWSRRIVSGGSTLTMQLARLVRPHPRTLRGKLGEMILALRIERS